ncbi:porphobilinogen synthase [Paenibacillus urinalis]|uniref:Delta-aminolevulinic acid dehydratase n=1 Tax=Paenibacillus urinalis TaxID=521520 RepID=A0AAX3MWQ1_9BACL|nr:MULTISPECIES: porphobilinogen synthase [Paenibacillus]WDH81821.1 porphobilinogen synthase [Paenibacillus urinalis]WDH97871.1 porphobilinogen synthase [Paenibacillus urinalis]WDI01548.1 porphobilinogen synthase [Paenibacillus urinalis]GAK43286.1 delta-aminolevulinic acid dehydratase [Paenibacillus sp. TCA20]
MGFPIVRHRRLRQSAGIRNMVRETHLNVSDFIQPIYVTYGTGVKQEISSMPGVYRFSLDTLKEEVQEIAELGIPAVLLFGIPDTKDAVGSSAYAENGIVQEATRLIKSWYPDLLVIADTCLCEFTDHGHCGMIHTHERDGHVCVDVLNDESLELLVKTAVSQAEAGADIIAPSNMMDGFVGAIRAGLDEAGFTHIPIMSYSVKYASGFYGPFREAADSAPQYGDRKAYQMDPANAREALREAETDVLEGADMLMVKPSLSYLDVMRTIKDQFDLPLVAYNVSGEYAMVKAAAINGWIDEEKVAMEILLSMKRAGADMIITYYGKDAARWLAVR